MATQALTAGKYSQPGALRAADLDRVVTSVLEVGMDAAREQLAAQQAGAV